MTDDQTPVGEEQAIDKSNLFVSNFSWDKDEEDLRGLFVEYGEIEDVRLIMDRETWRSRGFWFVKFVNEDDAERAIEALDGQEVFERELRVSVARPRPPRREPQY